MAACGDAANVQTGAEDGPDGSRPAAEDGGTSDPVPDGDRCDTLLPLDTTYPPFGTLEEMLAVTDSVVLTTVGARQDQRIPPDPEVWDAEGEIRHLVDFRSVKQMAGDRAALDTPIWVSSTYLRPTTGEPAGMIYDHYLDILTVGAEVVLFLSQVEEDETAILQPGPLPIVDGKVELPECALYVSQQAEHPSTLAEIDGMPLDQFTQNIRELAAG